MSGIILSIPGSVRVLTDKDYADSGARLNVPVPAVRGFAEAESLGTGFLPSGKPTILYEPHIMHRETGGRFAGARDRAGKPLSVPQRDASLYGASGEHQYQRLEDAMALDVDAALKATSWGAFQVMGFNHAMVGYPTVRAMVEDMVSGAAGQLRAFEGYIIKNNLQADMRLLPDARAAQRLARAYNGPGYEANDYDGKILAGFHKWSGTPAVNIPLRLGSRGSAVVTLQRALGLPPDGIFGPNTEAAVRKLQAQHRINSDGLAGADTHRLLGLPWPAA